MVEQHDKNALTTISSELDLIGLDLLKIIFTYWRGVSKRLCAITLKVNLTRVRITDGKALILIPCAATFEKRRAYFKIEPCSIMQIIANS